MRFRPKSQPGDERLARDPTADPVKRGLAIYNLSCDGYFELEPMMAELLHHPSYFLRGEVIQALVGVWKKSKYLPDAIRLLRTDPEWYTRRDAAFALSRFTWYRRRGAKREMIVRELVAALRRDEEESVQVTCYEQLLRLLAPEREDERYDLPADFTRERDVDWALLKPYLDK